MHSKPVTRAIAAVDHPDAVFGTAALGINDHGQLVGYYVDADWNFVGFHYQDGVLTTMTGPNGEYAYPAAINNLGQIAGEFSGGQGFVLTRGKYEILDLPGWVGPRGINDRGQVVGYVDFVSFVATPSH